MEATQMAAIDLRKFCATGERYGRLDMTGPWIKDGWEYATDARICIRIPAKGKPDTKTDDGQEFPDAHRLFKIDPADCVLEWPTEPFFKAMRKCPQCDGEGEITCEDCGDKICDCCYPGCNGKDEFEQEIYRRVGKHLIGVQYDRLINSLPGVRWSDKSISENRPLFFVFDGGQGVVMGMRRHESDLQP